MTILHHLPQNYIVSAIIEGFDTIILDLKDKLNSEQYQLCAEIEELLLNGIIGEECELKTDLIDQHYGKATKKIDAPKKTTHRKS